MFHHESHCLFLSWGISAHGEHRPVGLLSCPPPPGAVLWGFAMGLNCGYSCKCSSRRGGGFALINVVVSGFLFGVFERRFGTEEKGLAGKWLVSVELRHTWELLGYQFCLVKARQIAVITAFALVISFPPWIPSLKACIPEDDY